MKIVWEGKGLFKEIMSFVIEEYSLKFWRNGYPILGLIGSLLLIILIPLGLIIWCFLAILFWRIEKENDRT